MLIAIIKIESKIIKNVFMLYSFFFIIIKIIKQNKKKSIKKADI